MSNEVETVCPANPAEWRQWLEKNHRDKTSVWLVYYKKSAPQTSLTWSEAVDEALCFGWIDSKAKPLDHERFMQFFSKRKPKGTWSKVNKEKTKQLIVSQRMTAAGLETIEAAKKNGSWTILDEVEELIIPEDLEKALNSKPGAKDFFFSLSKSVRKHLLYWLVTAKRPETRQKRIDEIALLASQKIKPKPF